MLEGKRLENYQVVKKIGIKDISEYYLAKEIGIEDFEKIVVIKRIIPSLADLEEFKALIINEARVGSKLDHTNIVKIFKLLYLENTYFIVMEYIQGVDLKSIISQGIKKRNPLPIELSVKIIAEVCYGLDYAHKKKDIEGRPLHIVHRNINPENIIVSYSGEVKIQGFGMAQSVEELSKKVDNIPKRIVSYLSPEQLSNNKIDYRSDIFSVGVILWELVTGSKLFNTENPEEIIKQIKEGNIPNPRALNKYVPEKLENIIMKALAPNPTDRFTEISQFGDMLEEFIASIRAVANPTEISKYINSILGEEEKLYFQKDTDAEEFIKTMTKNDELYISTLRPSDIEIKPIEIDESLIKTVVPQKAKEETSTKEEIPSHTEESKTIQLEDNLKKEEPIEKNVEKESSKLDIILEEINTLTKPDKSSIKQEIDDKTPQKSFKKIESVSKDIYRPKKEMTFTIPEAKLKRNWYRIGLYISIPCFILFVAVISFFQSYSNKKFSNREIKQSFPIYEENESATDINKTFIPSEEIKEDINKEDTNKPETLPKEEIKETKSTIETKSTDSLSIGEQKPTGAEEEIKLSDPILIESDPPGADVYFNGDINRMKKKTPNHFRLRLNYDYEIEVVKEGYIPEQKHINLKSKNEKDRIVFNLKKIPSEK